MGIYDKGKIFAGALTPVLLNYGSPSAGGSYGGSPSRSSGVSTPSRSSSTKGDEYEVKYDGLPGANEALLGQEYALKAQKQALGEAVNKIMMSDSATEQEIEQALKGYYKGLSALSAQEAMLTVYNESSKDDKALYDRDMSYVTDKKKTDAPMLSTNVGELLHSGAGFIDIFRNPNAKLFETDSDGGILSTRQYMANRAGDRSLDINGKPLPYQPIVRSASDKEYLNAVRQRFEEAKTQTSGAGQETRSNEENLNATMDVMFEMLSADELNRAVERTVTKNRKVVGPSGQNGITVKDKEFSYSFEGDMKGLVSEIDRVKGRLGDPKLSDAEQDHMVNVATQLGMTFENMVRQQVASDAGYQKTGLITKTVSANDQKMLAVYAELDPSVLSTYGPNVRDAQFTVFDKDGNKQDLHVKAGHFPTNLNPKEAFENQVTPLRKSNGEKVTVTINDLVSTTPFIMLGRAHDYENTQAALRKAVVDNVSNTYIVGPKIKMDDAGKAYIDPADQTQTYMEAWINIPKESAGDIMYNTVVQGTVTKKREFYEKDGEQYVSTRLGNQEESGVYNASGRKMSLRQMFFGGSTDLTGANGADFVEDGEYYRMKIQIPVSNEPMYMSGSPEAVRVRHDARRQAQEADEEARRNLDRYIEETQIGFEPYIDPVRQEMANPSAVGVHYTTH